MSYSYERTAAVTPSLKQVLNGYLEQVARGVERSIPKHLAETSKVAPGDRNYSEVSFEGYTRSDLSFEGSVSFTIDYQPVRVRAFCSARSADMSGAAKAEFSIAYDEDLSKLTSLITDWLRGY